jgi:hypothetical protein
MLPFIQCHQVCGRAEAGGFKKPVSRESDGAAEAVETRQSHAEAKMSRVSFTVSFFKKAVFTHSAGRVVSLTSAKVRGVAADR